MTKFSLRLRVVLPVAVLLALPLHMAAQETQLYTWTGRVDGQIELRMQGSSTSASAMRGNESSGRFSVNSTLPQQEGVIRVALNGGRGDAVVVQQPNASNYYTAVVRVADANAGADRYQVTVYFRPTATYGAYNRERNDNADRDRNENANRRWNDNENRGRRMGQTAVLHWSGMVDANADVRWQRGSVTQRAGGGQALRGVNSSVSGNMNTGQMRQGGQATVSVREGRGQVAIVQQPSAENGYTTIVRIRDPQRGYGRYDFDVALQ